MSSAPEKKPHAALFALRERLADTRLYDRPKFARELDRLFGRKVPRPDFEKATQQLSAAIERSAAQVERLRQQQLKLEFDTALPISAHRDEIIRAIHANKLTVICGATGSGKTTQLPKMCIAAGRGTLGMIGHTQPRRIAARAIAQRLAQELGTQVGAAVGFQVRFNERTGPDTRVKLMTDGILLRELEHDRLLRRYDTIIIDEAHERSLNIDFLLGVLQRILPQRSDLRVIITSATIDPQRFADFFGGAPFGGAPSGGAPSGGAPHGGVPIIEVSGRSYPVDVRYRPLHGEAEEDEELTLNEGIVEAVRELDRDGREDILVFLPGEKQIRDAAEALSKTRLMHTEVLPLYARLSTQDQEKIFQGHSARRIVLATNVAETSLTVPGIRHVIDSGLARISRYSVRGKIQRLPIEKISQASADQRKGRAGREREGICIRLYAEDDFALRPSFTAPEVLRTNLASVILQMSALELGDPENFPFVDPPDTRLINDGYRLLQELKAVDASRNVTALGKQIAALPVDPRLARMLHAASHHSCLAEMLVLAAFLGSQDPRERPQDAQGQADQAHAQFADPRSDFIAVLNLWNAFQEQSAALGGSALRRWCRERFLSFLRLREWQELHRQLSEIASDLKLVKSATPAEYADLHQAILTGFLGNIGVLDERREYEGARGARFVIAPGTPLANKPPRWVVAASLMETTRVFARVVAAVEPQWIEAAGAHLLKREYAEPHWVEQRGFVAAFESTSLYGLTLSARKRINYGNVAPKEAREIFVREALVEGHTRFRAAFLDENRRVRHAIERMEAKLRRRDVLVDEQAIVDFYLARLPEHVHSISALERWLRESERRMADGGRREEKSDSGSSSPSAVRRSLFATPQDWMRREVPEITADSHPDTFAVSGNPLPLEYRFEPGTEADGITMMVPTPLLSEIDQKELSWLIPGWRLELITELLRSLPKHARRHFVPVPEYAARALAEINQRGSFHAAMAEWIARQGLVISEQELEALPLSNHLRFNLRVIAVDGTTVGQSRDLAALRRAVRTREIEGGAKQSKPATYRSWDFESLPLERVVERRGLKFTVYPTLRDLGESVELAEARSRAEADDWLRKAVLRLAILACPEQFRYARKQFNDHRELILLSRGVDLARPLPDGLAAKCFEQTFLEGVTHLPRNAQQFAELLNTRRGGFGEVVDRVLEHTLATLQELRTARQKLAALSAEAFAAIREFVGAQVKVFAPEDFPTGVPALLWPHLPRYLKAVSRRLDKAPGNLKRDAELASRIAPGLRAYRELAARADPTAPHPELDRLQWMIEELRVSVFAQDLGVATPVSEKRVADQVEKAREEGKR
jgi:ATP-dependent helicase HrpA